MKYTNILEKLLCLFDIVKTSWIDITFLAIVVISLILLFSKKISVKVCYIINVISSIMLIGIVVYNNTEVLGEMVDSIIDYTFTSIYFPSIYVYLIILFMMNIFGWISLFKANLERKYKVVNGIGLLVINFVLAIMLDIIATGNVDLFKKESLFSNTDLVVMMELSVNIFLVWLSINFIMFLADNIVEKIMVRKNAVVLDKGVANMAVLDTVINESEVKEEYVEGDSDSVDVEVENKFIPVTFSSVVVDEVESNNNKFIPNLDSINNNVLVNEFNLSDLVPKKSGLSTINNSVIYEEANSYSNSTNDILTSILNNDLPFVIKEEKNEKDMYTLNDYRIFNKMLKDIREHNNSNRIVIDKNLEYRLITKYSNETYDMFKKMLKIYSN